MSIGLNTIVKGAATAAGAILVGWTAHAAVTWLRYGRPRRNSPEDSLLDRFMPLYEVAERHQIKVAAPAAVTLAAANRVKFEDSATVRAIFRVRELVMGGAHGPTHSGGILDQTLALGWGILAEEAGREVAVGAVTQPWRADVRFRDVPADRFAAFDEPGYAKIVWTLAADSLGPAVSLFRTETRVVTTDGTSRRRFRIYWSMFSPGIRLIRNRTLRLVKREAELAFRDLRRNHLPPRERILLGEYPPVPCAADQR